MVCRLEIRLEISDTAGWKPALLCHLHKNLADTLPTRLRNRILRLQPQILVAAPETGALRHRSTVVVVLRCTPRLCLVLNFISFTRWF